MIGHCEDRIILNGMARKSEMLIFGPYAQDPDRNKMNNPFEAPQASRNFRGIPRNAGNRNGKQRSGESRASTTVGYERQIPHRAQASKQK